MKHTALVLAKIIWDDETHDPPSEWSWEQGIEFDGEHEVIKPILIQDDVKEVQAL